MKLQLSILAFGITLAAGATFVQLGGSPLSTTSQSSASALTSPSGSGTIVASGASFKTSAKPQLRSGGENNDD